ncbi:heme lyase CcmF/NrfE family subunit [Alteraurantiacibacter buctensis]|uniref:Heme lyase NrfEFG subunit NrfE n=1 Tax=Alteraurantiacibacter buctensis TaxID=1503981 RepID=A0A844YZP4_9SPHN|nr:heme lyase CcmF/NrfE family subunit [Alteraurantiacibacter buctensis]MXO72486.1 heme lyase NrfEFG subunit NrfE [Alteraurantiacibacter buctensis]
MIAEFGLVCLWLAAALAGLQLVAGLLGLKSGWEGLAVLTRPAALVQALLCLVSFLTLVVLFARTDLSVALVAANSHSAKPMVFKLSGTWGNHEGSMLLWVTVMSVAGGLIASVERRLPERTMLATLGAQAFVALGFYAFLLFASNPFERLPSPPPEGNGLNPLLQDIGLAFHPPTLYVGYVGLSVAFSFVVGALLTRQVTPDFAKAMRPWVLGAWLFLTLGITAGSYWAYYELGWGGWWFWDPTENASLMPWLAATALLHSASVLAARDALRAWTVMLGVIAFSMSMVGTFLVRSGILTSVHAFAVDPERGGFILALLAINIGMALALFATRAGTVAEGERFSVLSREGALVINNVALSAILGVVLLGTLYPLLTEAFDVRVSVGPPYFNPVTAIFALPMLLVLAVGPLLRWRGDKLARVRWPMVALAVLGLVVLAGVALLSDVGLLPLLGFAVAAVVLVGSLLPLKGRNLLRLPLATWGMVVAHFGVGIALFGMAADTAFQTERLVAANVGDVIEVGPWSARLESVAPVAGPNWTALEAAIAVRHGDGAETLTHPQARSFWSPPTETSEVSLVTRWNGQLYVALGDQAQDGRWQLRLWWKPFVTWIWYGGLLIALGGVLALLGRVLTDVRRRRASTLIAARRGDAEVAA